MRRFEHDDLYWEVDQSGEQLTTRFGTTGEPARTVVRELATPRDAQDALARAIARKTDLGFEQVDARTAGGRQFARAPDLEQRIQAAPVGTPAELDSWEVYRDVQIDAGVASARLELLQLELECARDPTRTPALEGRLRTLREQVVPSIGSVDGSSQAFGFYRRIETAELPDDTESLRFLRELVLLQDGNFSPRTWDQLRAAAPGGLRRIHMDAHPDSVELSWITVGRFDLFEACPRLTQVHLAGSDVVLGRVDAPCLKRLVLQSTGLGSEPLDALVAGRADSLEHLEIWLGTPDRMAGPPPTVEQVQALMAKPWPALHTLGLKNSVLTDALVPAAASAPLTRQLKTLDLSGGTLTDVGARALLRDARAFQRLELDLRENLVSEAMASQLQRRFPSAFVHPQRESWDEDEVYVSVAE